MACCASKIRLAETLALAVAVASSSAHAQVTAAPPTDTVIAIAIAAPRNPLPAEAASAGVSRFSFIVYGDTRGRRDGIDPQYEHSLIVDAMLRTIAELADGPDPVRFVLQSGDAVVNGRDPRQWNASFTGLINRLTTEGGVPYFLAPGNHDVTGAAALDNPGRLQGLANYLRAVAQLIPPDGSTRRLAGYPTYAFGYGNTFVLALDSNIAEDSVQLAWALVQLEGLDRDRYPHVVAFFHHPVYSSGPHGAAIVERPTAALRASWMPLFRGHGVGLLVTGHEHLFEHWVERYRDGQGRTHRLDQLVTGGGGAPLYPYRGEPDLRAYVAESGADSARVEHLVRPGPERGDNPYHFVVVHVDGERMWLEVESVDWGSGYAPYRSNRAVLRDSVP
ncbi:MAG: metallophosphoesterase [Longimicrobiales bacterium]|nr:metallophosphoesterase [Longimicrobiales bacterium]